MERMGEVLNDPQYHRVPPLPAEHPDRHRIFQAGLAQPPRMWLSHPLNHEREANAKRHYIAAPLDDRNAWALFDAAPVLRERVTAKLIGETTLAPLPVEDSLQALEAQFARESLQGRYRGVYLGRPVARAAASAAELVDADATVEDLAGLYPVELLDEVERLRRLAHELAQLRALQAGALKAPSGLMRHRDRTLDRRELPQQVQAVERELRQVEARLLAHDRRCRGAHRAAARRLGGGWEAYLEGLLALLHYAEHGEADLRDAHGVLADAWQVESATRRVGQAGVARLLAAANALQGAMQRLSDQRDEVVLDARMREALQVASWGELLGEFKLPPARGEALGDWLNVVDGWVNQLAGACGRLRAEALDQLLRTEAALARRLQGDGGGDLPATAPEPSRVPAAYATLPAGRERERRTKLGWVARFQTADGLLPALARLGVAGGIVGGVLGLGGAMGEVNLVVYNGLGTPVTVRLAADRVLAVSAGGIERLQVPAGTLRHIEARSPQGALIESFDVEAKNTFGSLVYNVAAAAPLVERTVAAGRGEMVPDRPLGAPRWLSTSAGQVLEAAPRTTGSKGGGGTRTVLEGLAEALPAQQLAMLPGPAERARLVATHLRWDATSHPSTLLWLAEVEGDPARLDLLRERLKAEPDDAMLLRAEQESVRGTALAEVCARHAAASRAAPDRPGLRYAAVRCEPDGPQKWQDFIEAHARWPAHAWLGHAAGYAELDFGRFADGLATLADARVRLPALAPSIAMDEARLRRALKLDDAAHMAELQRVSAPLRQRLALESGGEDADLPREFAELAQGRIEAALRTAGASPQRLGRLLVLAAASEGADPALLPRALALPPGEDATSLWVGAALAMRAGQDIGPYVSRLERRQPTDAALMRAFLELVQASRDLAMADRVLAEMGFHARAQAYAAGVVLLGRDAPAAWRDAARRLLFADERPYFS